MPQPTAPVDIANIALDLLGDRPVPSIEVPETPAAVILARHYDQIRETTLREYIWNFAKKSNTLARTGSGNIDYDSTFTLPFDCLRLLSIGEKWCFVDDYDIEGRNIHLNTTGNELKIRYIKDEQDVSKFDSLFINIFSIRLALSVAYKFSLKKGLVDMLNARLATEEMKAISINSQERPPLQIERSRALSARRTNWYYGSPFGYPGSFSPWYGPFW